jgi:2-methylcitrate dehydratase PrpD
MRDIYETELTLKLSNYIIDINEGSIPSDIFEHSKICFLDWLGCVIGGHNNHVVKKIINFSNIVGGNEQASIILCDLKKNILHAATINGAAAHILGYDDTSTVYIGHSSAVLMPGILAVSEWKGSTGINFMLSHIIGFKIAYILGMIAGLKQYNKGWWTTQTIGYIASAAACSRLLNLNKMQTVHAIGLACNMSSGLKSIFGSDAKTFFAGYTASGGITAALLANENMKCSEMMLEGSDGYLQVFDITDINSEFEKYFEGHEEFNKLAQKYHASCHFTHSAIEAALRILENKNINKEEIKNIIIEVSELAFKAAGKTEIRTILDAKFSITYCVANAIIRKNTGIYIFTDKMIHDENITKFMKKIFLQVNKAYQPMESKVIIEKYDGIKEAATVNVFEEIPPLKIKKERIINKFHDICEPLMQTKKINNIVNNIMTLENVKNMKSLIDIINN